MTTTTTTATTPRTTLPALLDRRLTDDGAAPFITFYDDASGERTELSATTFANWVAKTANLLTDGLGVGAGDRAVLALPVHWQSVVVVAGCWAAGLEVVFDGSGAVAFTAAGRPGAPPAAPEVVCLSLRPLGAGLSAADTRVTDYAAEVRAYGDRFGGPPPAPADAALAGRSHAAVAAGPGESRRVLLAPAGDPLLDADLLTASYVAPLVGGGSVVLCRHADRSVLTRRAATELADLAG